jgi:hypothetical protein
MTTSEPVEVTKEILPDAPTPPAPVPVEMTLGQDMLNAYTFMGAALQAMQRHQGVIPGEAGRRWRTATERLIALLGYWERGVIQSPEVQQKIKELPK